MQSKSAVVECVAGRYLLHSLIAEREGSRVYRATDLRIGQAVAVKLYEGRDREWWRREAAVVSRLNHPGVVRLIESGDDPQPFIVMEFVAGRSLSGHIKRGSLPLGEALAYGAQLAAALTAVHSAGLVHGDIKPSNVLVTADGRAVLIDFGECAVLRADGKTQPVWSEVSEPGFCGAFDYWPPEKISDDPLDPRSDVYGLGLVLYEMVTGKCRPLERRATDLTVLAVHRELPEPPRNLRPGLPRRLDRLIMRALQKEPADRFTSAAELSEELLKVSRGWVVPIANVVMPVAAARVRAREATVRAWRALPFPINVLLVVAMIAGAGWWFYQSPAPRMLRLNRIVSWKSEAQDMLLGARLSPDGRHIVFSSVSAGHRRLWLQDVSGGELVRLTERGESYSPIWSPKGDEVAYVGWDGQETAIWRQAPGQAATKLMTSPGPNPVPITWTASRRLYFELHSNLYRLNITTAQAEQLTAFDPLLSSPRGFAVAPDELQVAYIDQRDGQEDLWLADLRGAHARRLTNDKAAERSPAWDSSQKRLLFTCQRGGYRICSYDFEKHTVSELTGALRAQAAVSNLYRPAVGGRLQQREDAASCPRRGDQTQIIEEVDMAAQNLLLAALTGETLERLRGRMSEVSLPQGEVLHRPGQDIQHVYFPLDRLISVTVTMAEGGTVEAGAVGSREMVGINAFMGWRETTQTTYIVQVAGAAVRLEAGRLREEFNHNRRLRDVTLLYTQAFIAQLSQNVACSRLGRALARGLGPAGRHYPAQGVEAGRPPA